MTKRLSKSPCVDQDENKSKVESRHLRSAKSSKHKDKSLNLIKDNGSKSLPTKKLKRAKDDSEKKSKIDKSIDIKVESKLNCKKSLLNHFNDVQDEDEEDIPLGKLLGNRNTETNDNENSLTKGHSKQSLSKTPSRRFLRPRRSLNSNTKSSTSSESNCNIGSPEKRKDLNSSSKSSTSSDSKSGIESPEKSQESIVEFIAQSGISDKIDGGAKESLISEANDCHCSDQNSVQSFSTNLPKEHVNVSLITKDHIESDDPLLPSSENNQKCTNDSECKSSSVVPNSDQAALLHIELSSFEDKTLVIDNDASSSVQFTPTRNTNNIPKDVSPTIKSVDNALLTPLCYNSPSTGILRKRKLQDSDYGFSPSSKIRRVAFSEIVSTVEIPNRHDNLTKRDVKTYNQDQFNRNEGSLVSQSINKENGTPVFPELTSSSCPIEVILPRISTSPWARGLKNLLSAKNIKTVGDLAAMSEPELEMLPVPQPKSLRIRDALKHWMDHTNNKLKKTAKDFHEEGVDMEGRVVDNMTSKEMHSIEPKEQVCGDDSHQAIAIIHEDNSNEDKEQNTLVNRTLKMFEDLDEVLGRCKGEELSRTQLKTMVSMLTSIQNKVAEHVTNIL